MTKTRLISEIEYTKKYIPWKDNALYRIFSGIGSPIHPGHLCPNCSIGVKSLRAKRSVFEYYLLKTQEVYTKSACEYCENYLSKKRDSGVFARHTIEHRARLRTWVECDDTRHCRKFDDVSLSVWREGTMARLHQRPFSAAGVGFSVFCTEVGMPGRAVGVEVSRNMKYRGTVRSRTCRDLPYNVSFSINSTKIF